MDDKAGTSGRGYAVGGDAQWETVAAKLANKAETKWKTS